MTGSCDGAPLWASIDPAKGKSGVARWMGDVLLSTLVVKPRGNKGRFYCGADVCSNRFGAWVSAIHRESAIVVERGMGGRINVAEAQGWIRGYLAAECDIMGIDCTEINVSEWRRVIKEDQGVSWPRDSARCKALAVRLVHDLYGRDVTEDEADAVLLGRAAIRMGVAGA